MAHERTLVALLVAPLLWVALPSASLESLAESKLRTGAWIACALALVVVTVHRPSRQEIHSPAAPTPPPPSSERDPVTGLAHRPSYASELANLASRETPDGPGEIGFLLLGIDRLEELEETHGRTAREEAMRRTARILLEEMRPGNACALWSESEFVAHFPGISRERLEKLAEKLRRKIREEFHGSRHKATASIGIAIGENPEAASLTDQAEQALRRARENGGDRVESPAADLAASPG